ncbi:hypothetical protein O181_093392 [Austropuccinia psidii MF-1]|uniref:Uncharacterized protein n=1 Tax=Austropuccinia psidii MF-1 TaxID=1389203 RepID=A0A9Q3J0Y5_9BASI|nr:hypothetical protein [Austropuccinia psidii MF-1]
MSCTKWGIPCILSSTTTNACDACQQVHKKCSFVVQPFQPHSQWSSCPRHPCKDSFVVSNDESIPKQEWTLGPQTGQHKQFRMISPVPSSIDLSTPPPMVTSLLNWSKVTIRPMKDGDGNHTDFFPLHIEQIPPNPPQQDSPIQCLPCKQTPRQPTPGPSGTQWLEDLSHEPSQHDEPPIPGPSPSSEPPENVATCEPEPEVAPTQSMEEPFDPPPISPALTPPPSTPTPVPSLDLPCIAAKNPTASSLVVPSSSHSYNDACQEFTDLRPTLMIPQAINQILLEHCRLPHTIPFVDARGIPGGTKLPPWPGTGGLSKGEHHQDILQILRKIKLKESHSFHCLSFVILSFK